MARRGGGRGAAKGRWPLAYTGFMNRSEHAIENLLLKANYGWGDFLNLFIYFCVGERTSNQAVS